MVENGEFKVGEHLENNKDLRYLLTGFKKDFMVNDYVFYYFISKSSVKPFKLT